MKSSLSLVPILVMVLLLCCCACVVLAGVLGFAAFAVGGPLATQVGPVLTQVGPVLTEVAYTPVPSAVPVVVRTPLPTPLPGGQDTYTALENDQVPASNLRELALRFKGVTDVPEVVSTTPAHYALGDTTKFWISNQDTNTFSSIDAKLAYMTDNVYFFVETGVPARQSDVKKLADVFQAKTYPTDRDFFGSEWTPGVDGDPHVYILYARGLGANVGGYFDGTSEYSHLVNQYSNEKEMFVLNAGSGTPLNDSYWAGTLAHEFQHMIRWYHHPNDDVWMNEGFSMLAESINGYEPGNESFFLSNPDLQLNTWSNLSSSPMESAAHYGASYLFQQYFLDRFGKKGSQALTSDQNVGLKGVDDALAALGETDPATGQPLTAVDVFADWTIANYLNDQSLGDRRYAYSTFTDKVSKPTTSIRTCPRALTDATVHQFATDYIAIRCTGAVTLNFTGSLQTQLIPTRPHGGRYAFWSNRKDSSDTSLTREFDLTGVSTATLDYWAWWKIEKDFDYAYVDVSADGGQTWKILKTPDSTDSNPNDSNLGNGITGCSGGGDPSRGCAADWVEEKVDLSAYAGKKIQVRFEYITDQGENYDSLMIDDIRVPELNYACDFESDTCGWDAKGFVRVDNLLPQTFTVQVIHKSGGQTTVERLPLDANEQGSLALNLKSGDTTVLVVSGTTPFTTESASYQYEVK